jgi:REP element-mobilizing transposase RayT
MSIHTVVTKPGIYFITFTCYQWLSLIGLTNSYDKVYKWFDVLTTKGHAINGYVIMPNHLHLLLYYAGLGSSLNKVVGNGKRFLGYDIINRLTDQDEEKILSRLSMAVTPAKKKKGYKHEVWEDSFDVKLCWTEKFIMQKLNYIHNNPCAGKWNLADSPIHYVHSSASFYISGKMNGYPVKDYRNYLQVEEKGW